MLQGCKAVFRRFVSANGQPGLLDILYQVVASPSEGFREISRRRPLGLAMLTAAFISLVFAFSTFPYPSDFTRVILQLEKGSVSLAPALLFWETIFLAALLASAGILHACARLLRGHGSYLGLLCGLVFAGFPAIFLAPLVLLRELLGFSGTILYLTVLPLISLWVMTLQIIAVRQNYGLSLRRAIAAYSIPGGALLIALISIAAAIIAL